MNTELEKLNLREIIEIQDLQSDIDQDIDFLDRLDEMDEMELN